MADEEHKEEHHEEHHEEHGKKEEHGKHPEKNKKLLWWGLGLAGAGLLVSLLLFNKGNAQASDQTVANPSAPFVPNPTNPYDASANEYWPVLQSNPSTGQVTGTSGSTSSSSGSKKKKKSKSSSSHSKSKTPKSGTKTKTTPHHTVAANPHAHGAHGWVYTAKGGENVQNLFNTAWPGQPMNFGYHYANNAQLLKGQKSNILKKGQQIVL